VSDRRRYEDALRFPLRMARHLWGPEGYWGRGWALENELAMGRGGRGGAHRNDAFGWQFQFNGAVDPTRNNSPGAPWAWSFQRWARNPPRGTRRHFSDGVRLTAASNRGSAGP